jgi:hypothetical protein
MLDAKRGLVAKCTKGGYTHYLYKVTSSSYYMATRFAPSGLYAKDDNDAIKCFAKYCGVHIDDIIA